MSVMLRPGTPADAALCGPICFEAFKAIDDEHNFPWDFPSAEVATGLLTMMLSNPGFYSVVAEKNRVVVGSNFSRRAQSDRRRRAYHGRSGIAKPDDRPPTDVRGAQSRERA